MKPVVSIVVPAYNAGKTLKRCLDSVRVQTFEEWELILVDDGSTDETSEIGKAYETADSRITYIRQDNQGVSSARNKGIKTACGEYLMFIDSDDYVLPEFVEHFLRKVQSVNGDIAIGGFTLLTADGREKIVIPPVTGTFSKEIWEHVSCNFEIFGYMCNKIFRSSVVRDHGISLNMKMRSQEDLDFCLSVLSQSRTVAIFENWDYQYVLEAGKREPEPWVYIQNQLKISKLAEENYRVSSNAKDAIRKRIQKLIYSWCYSASEQGKMAECQERMERICGLTGYFQTQDGPAGMHDVVTKLAIAGRFNQIDRYFKIRNCIKRVMARL